MPTFAYFMRSACDLSAAMYCCNAEATLFGQLPKNLAYSIIIIRG